MASETAAPPKKGKKGLIVWILLVLVAIGAGAVVPWVIALHPQDGHETKKKEVHKKIKQEAIPFDSITVNLCEDRFQRYLRAKIMVAVDEVEAKEITELLNNKKPFLKNWLNSYLSDQSVQEVSRKVGVNRIRREIRDQFNAMLFPDGEEKIIDVLFDEFVVQ
jgi:flagellar basal body-associated protein FliL